MIEFRSGDILKDESEALVNPVNCVGIMGRGLALQFKDTYPDNFKFYAAACQRNEVQPGRMLVFETGKLSPPHYIINFPTKRHWRDKSRIEDIQGGLKTLVEEVLARGIWSIAIPSLGSGLGGLDWATVRPHIEDAAKILADVCVCVVVYEPKMPGVKQQSIVK
jgi:O-acetyl-ADP-ribose deacetylase (regulator of RNase III)